MPARLFEPVTVAGLTLKNRIVISPMCQYSARDGFVTDWHLVHLGRFALGGAGLVMVEATAVTPEGRITHGDTGLWSDAQVDGLARIAGFLKDNGAAAGIQLAHAGRKASIQRPWFGNGPLTDADRARGDEPWPVVAPSAIPTAEGWLMPKALSAADIEELRGAFKAAAERALQAGFQVIELHAAHGYLLHQFLSPLSNQRDDAYGGDRERRMRLPLEIAADVRAVWPKELPVFLRVSAVDQIDGGITLDDTVALAQRLADVGIDVVDCSSGGLRGPATAAKVQRDYGFQVGYAERVRKEAGLATMAVGLIVDPHHAESIVAEGQADLVAIARQALVDPNWPLHAEAALGAAPSDDPFASWPHQAGWWLARRQPELDKLGPWRGAERSLDKVGSG